MRALLILVAGMLVAVTPVSAQIPLFHRSVTFLERLPDNDSVVRVYLDRDGNLYPDAGESLSAPGLRSSRSRLPAYYRTQPAAWSELRTRLGMAPVPFTDEAWDESQSLLLRRVAGRIVGRVSRQGRSPVVVLVHGFNVDNANPSYDQAMTTIAQSGATVRPLYLHVHWDGDYARNVAGTRDAWNRANRNAPLVGLALRRILAAIPSSVPVRVITHSLGGSVVASALWTRSEYVQRREPEYATYLSRSAEARRYTMPTHPDLRVGMVVPAMGGRAFATLTGSVRSGVELMMIGQNDQDVVVTKGWISPRLFGSTALAVKVAEYCDHVFPVYSNDDDRATQLVDFDIPGVSDYAHGFDVYLRRSKPMELFLDTLLRRGEAELLDSDKCLRKKERSPQ